MSLSDVLHLIGFKDGTRSNFHKIQSETARRFSRNEVTRENVIRFFLFVFAVVYYISCVNSRASKNGPTIAAAATATPNTKRQKEILLSRVGISKTIPLFRSTSRIENMRRIIIGGCWLWENDILFGIVLAVAGPHRPSTARPKPKTAVLSFPARPEREKSLVERIRTCVGHADFESFDWKSSRTFDAT